MISFKNTILEFLRLIVICLFKFIVSIGSLVIYLITYEPFSGKKITLRKIRRIRFLTNLKIKFYNSHPQICKYLKLDKYFKYIKKKYGHGL